MVRRPQRATRTVTLVPYTTCVRAYAQARAGMSAAQTRHVPAPQWHDRADAAAWAETAATQIAQPLQRDLQTQPQALLLLSGGSTPEPVYRALAAQPLAWSRIVIALVDERFVPPDSAGSNGR